MNPLFLTVVFFHFSLVLLTEQRKFKRGGRNREKEKDKYRPASQLMKLLPTSGEWGSNPSACT